MDAFLKRKASDGKPSATAASSSSTTTTQKHTDMPWVEKYRPKSVNEVSSQEEVVHVLSKSIETGNLPHLLFYGPPGTGKTSTILAIARQLYGHDIMKQSVLELNASDDRGIKVVRTKVKSFSQVMAATSSTSGHPCPPYKLIILDEADSMTTDAQAALRRTMETYSKTTRFCLICNYVTRIIEPLASRCAKFRFKPLKMDSMCLRLKEIASAEGFSCDEDVYTQLYNVSGGDMRRAITLFQSAYRLDGDSLDANSIFEISGVVGDAALDRFLNSCKSEQYTSVKFGVDALVAEGYAAAQVLSQLLVKITDTDDLDDSQKSAIAEVMGEVDERLCDGADEYLQLLHLAYQIHAQYRL